MVLTYQPNQVAKSWLAWQTDKPSAAHWHGIRRALLLRTHPEIKALLATPEPATPILGLGLASLHLGLACLCDGLPWWAVTLAAGTAGSLLAFNLQALNHELCHQRRAPRHAFPPTWSGFISHMCCHPLTTTIVALAGSACTSIPWFACALRGLLYLTSKAEDVLWSCLLFVLHTTRFSKHLTSHKAVLWALSCLLIFPAFSDYHQGGHAMHHLHAGTPYDNDATALFWAWEKVPVRWLDSTVGSVLWASAVALALPVIYFGSLLTWYCIHPALNQREVVYAAVDLAATAVAYRLAWQQAGSQALVYLVLSTAFSMGFLGHPLLAFWVTQHVCESPPSLDGDILCPGEHRALWRHVAQRALPIYQYTAQPSLSYYGSTMYNWLTVNELLHVEHHDFAQIPWTRLPWLARLAPQLYHGHDADGRPLTPCRCGGHEAAALSEELRSRTPEPNEGRQLAPAKSASACSCAEVRRFLLSTERAWQGWAALASPPQPADQREAEADTASNTGPYATQRERARCAPLSAAEQLAAVPPMTALYSLYGDIILPWLRARDMKFDFACRHTLETHVNSRQAIAFDIYTQLQRLPSGVARAAMEENAL